ncbi:site-specific integrase [Micromonospora echinaurantiaca]|uniref:site-specific integrase n=1 Tax=Micromonospora echinaurantiaca TaxID=47857 RepID=UPI00379A1DE1
MAAFPAYGSKSYRPISSSRAPRCHLPGRYRGQTRVQADSDLRVFLRWCTDQVLNPLAAARVDIERYVRWLQDVQASTVSRRLSVVVGFYRVSSSTPPVGFARFE